MVKLMVAVKRRADPSPEEFHRHWRTAHVETVKSNPASRRNIRKYVQCHTVEQAYENQAVPCDGVVELWFDSIADQEAFFSDPDYLDKLRPDESRFADMERTVLFLTREEMIIDRTGA